MYTLYNANEHLIDNTTAHHWSVMFSQQTVAALAGLVYLFGRYRYAQGYYTGSE